MCTYNLCLFNKQVFYHKLFFKTNSQLLSLIQLNERVEMNKFHVVCHATR